MPENLGTQSSLILVPKRAVACAPDLAPTTACCWSRSTSWSFAPLSFSGERSCPCGSAVVMLIDSFSVPLPALRASSCLCQPVETMPQRVRCGMVRRAAPTLGREADRPPVEPCRCPTRTRGAAWGATVAGAKQRRRADLHHRRHLLALWWGTELSVLRCPCPSLPILAISVPSLCAVLAA